MTATDLQTTVDRSVIQTWGVSTEYRPLGANPLSPTGVFFDPTEPLVGFPIAVESRDPMLFYHRDDVPIPTRNDEVTVNGRSFRVKDKDIDEGDLIGISLEERQEA